jgi:hypothetical protein
MNKITLELQMKNTIISRFAIVSGLLVFNTLGFATVARAGEGGVAGAAAFTITDNAGNANITGVAVSSAIGKENASAAAFNYDAANASGLQNSAWSLGSGGIQTFSTVGAPAGFDVATTEDSARATEMTNSFNDSFSVKLGTTSGDSVADIDANPANP